MDQDGMFYIVRIVLVSIVHGITLSILARGERHSRRVVAAAMAGLTLAIAIIGSIFVLIAPSGLEHVSWTAYMMLLVMGCVFCFVSSGSALTERLFVYIMYVAVFMLSVGYAGIISKAFFREDAELAQLVIRTAFSVVFIILLKVSLRDRLYRLVDGLSVHGMEITMFSWLTGLCVLAYAIFSFFFVDDLLMNAIVLALLTLMVISIFAIANTIVQLTSRELEMERATGRQRLLESELYLGAHDESVVSEGLASWCGNPLVDAQLRIAWRYCASRSIAFSADIQLPDGIGVDDIDFVSVMGNLLENAIQAASAAAEPSVSVSSRVSGGKLLLEIGNSFSGTAPLEEGTGLESVRYILSRYGGLLSQSGSDGFFVSRVIMPICN